MSNLKVRQNEIPYSTTPKKENLKDNLMNARYIATPEEDLNKYTNTINMAATLVDKMVHTVLYDENGEILVLEELDILKTALLELGYEIK